MFDDVQNYSGTIPELFQTIPNDCGLGNPQVYGSSADRHGWKSVDAEMGMQNLDGMCNERRR